MFDYVLANLLADCPHAVGVLFLDDSGETVDLACSEFTPYQMRVMGAYLGITLRQVGRLVERSADTDLHMIHVEKERLHIHALPLPDGYYLVLVQRRPAVVSQARARLAQAGEQLRREFFGS